MSSISWQVFRLARHSATDGCSNNFTVRTEHFCYLFELLWAQGYRFQSFCLGVMDKSNVTTIVREWESKDFTQLGATGIMARVAKETTVSLRPRRKHS